MAAQVFPVRWGAFRTSKFVVRPQFGISELEQRPVRAKGPECQVWGLGWCGTALSKCSENNTEAVINTKPCMSWSGQLEKDLLLVSLFFQLRTWFKPPWQSCFTGITVHPLRGLLTQPYWHHCRAIILKPGISVSGILLLLSMAAFFYVLVMGGYCSVFRHVCCCFLLCFVKLPELLLVGAAL